MIAIKSEDINELISKLREGGSKQELGDYLKSKLNKEQGQRLNEIIHDDKALRDILNTPKAKDLLRKLTGDENGQS